MQTDEVVYIQIIAHVFLIQNDIDIWDIYSTYVTRGDTVKLLTDLQCG